MLNPHMYSAHVLIQTAIAIKMPSPATQLLSALAKLAASVKKEWTLSRTLGRMLLRL